MERTFTAVFAKTDGWWAAHIVEIPEAVSQGKTLDEARRNLRAALDVCVDEDTEDIAKAEDVVVEPMRMR